MFWIRHKINNKQVSHRHVFANIATLLTDNIERYIDIQLFVGVVELGIVLVCGGGVAGCVRAWLGACVRVRVCVSFFFCSSRLCVRQYQYLLTSMRFFVNVANMSIAACAVCMKYYVISVLSSIVIKMFNNCSQSLHSLVPKLVQSIRWFYL